jgi:predicted chitinase
MEVSALQLQRCAIYTRAARCAELVPFLNASLPQAQVTNPLRAAMYLAQLEHETDHFRTMEEYANGTAYDLTINPRLAAKLGNTQPGDGARYKGRGAIQLTGRANYSKAGLALGLPLEEHPELAAQLDNAFRLAAWYWTAHDLNGFADKGDIHGATKAINGGLNGLLERTKAYDRACDVLGVLSLRMG